jgi:hypothetical protein
MTVDQALALRQVLLDLLQLLSALPEQKMRPRGIDSLQRVLRELPVAVATHNANSSVRMSVSLTGVLTWLCLLGVIVPLCFLSAYSDSQRWWLTSGFALGILAIPAFLAVEWIQIFRLGRGVSVTSLSDE